MSSFDRFAAPVVLAASFSFGCSSGTGAAVGSGGPQPEPSATSTATGGTSAAGGSPTISAGTGNGAAPAAGGDNTATGAGTGGAPETTPDSGAPIGGTGVIDGTAGSAGATPAGGTTGNPTTPDWGTPVSGGPTGTGVTATVTVSPGTTVGTVGPEYNGFSYEKTHVTNDSLNSTNTKLVALYKLLGTPMMRLGANDVDLSNWTGTGAAPTAPSGQPFTKNIVSGHVDQLCAFLKATGSRIIYGVNYKTGNVTASAAEAAYVMSKCGAAIVYGFEVGNELDKYGGWSSLQSQWESFGTAIVATPGAMLIGPAAAGGDSASLSVPFAKTESVKFGAKLILLTQHYYVAGAGTSGATVSALQTLKADMTTISQTMNSGATQYKIRDRYRFGECGSFYGHGQMGVSDALIGGLWSIDMMFINALNGSSGVNFHGGETGMDGTKPFYYEPIMENQGAVTGVQPVYYGMLLLSQMGTGPVLSTTVTSSNANFTAYTIKASGFTSVVLNNKSGSSGVNATVDLGAAVTSASAIYMQGTPAGSLTAPASAVTLAGAAVTTSGTWNRNPPFTQTVSGKTVSVYVPPGSAAVVRVLQ